MRADCAVKVLDFGLAKALAAAPGMGISNLSQSPTITGNAALTGMGVLLGTAAYMSPEQAAGGVADKRSDLWAFGVVLMEMLTGRPVFAGESVSHVLASVLKSEPYWARCRQARRSRFAVCSGVVSRRIASGGSTRRQRRVSRSKKPRPCQRRPVRPRRKPHKKWDGLRRLRCRRRWRSSRSSCLSACSAVFSGCGRGPSMTRATTRDESAPRCGALRREHSRHCDLPGWKQGGVCGCAWGRSATLRSSARSWRSDSSSWDREFEWIFFSPDGSSLGVLTAAGGLMKVSLADGLVVPLAADADFFAGGTWGPDDQITFGRKGALWRIPAAGGSASQITQLDGQASGLSHLWPTIVDDGKVVLFTVVTGSERSATRIEALTLATGRRQIVVAPGAFPQYAPGGHLLFVRNDALLAATFDVDRLALTGPPIRVVENLAVVSTGAPMAALSQAGVLAYAAGGQATSRLVSVSGRVGADGHRHARQLREPAHWAGRAPDRRNNEWRFVDAGYDACDVHAIDVQRNSGEFVPHLDARWETRDLPNTTGLAVD